MRWITPLIFTLGMTIAAAPSVAAEPAADARKVQVAVLVEGLENPWSLAFLPGTPAMLITERPGKLRLWQPGQKVSEPIEGTPEVYHHGQGGLFDVVLAPDFEQSRRIYLSYAEKGEGEEGAGTAVGFGRLSEDHRRLSDFKVIFRQRPKLSSGEHFGGRLAFDRQGMLYIALGENNRRPTAQQLNKHQGKIVRLTAAGEVPPDNPFVNDENARPEIWSYGIRNPQGLAVNPWTGDIWENEHGPRGGDEINIIARGANYGWPIATYGINYSGLKIPEAKGEIVEGTRQPAWFWQRSPAVSGMAFYDADRFGEWRHSVFIGALKQKVLLRMTLDGDKVTGEQRLLADRNERIRDVRVGPDGYVYVLTDESDGKLLKVGLATPGA
ncbi:glucose/arabinose dehydrogenase [Biostraticola tofi]|uniref:Glucose/arabinose dehydrogenase n=2 Tax=Biostraticola tofi TaxID=466109 RepID=A0A4R3YY20_9GAMM|nr:PQQ-dependent sugar dehydrogenase [Biostraticola tofi]TCV98095.1 glucose/arabinose dehydrogenase [Biostraticola tofi]